MTTETTPKAGEWKKRESFGSALVQILIVGAILTGAVFLVYKRGTNKKEIAELMKEARVAAMKGNAADLKKALEVTEKALAKDAASPDALAFAAAMYTDLWLIHREPGADARAREYLDKAKKADAQTDERFGAEALHLVAAGDAKGADSFVEALRQKGGSGARLFYAQAVALQKQGNLKLARQSFKAAMDKQWKDVNLACAYGEAILLEGVPGAIDAFNKATGQNPELFRGRLDLALARVQKGERVGDAESILKELSARESELSVAEKARLKAVQGHILLIQEQPDQAIALADAALTINPDDPWAQHVKASALAQKKDPAAPAALDTLLNKVPSAPVFYFEGASDLQKAGMLDPALAVLAKYEAFFKNVKNQTADGKEEAYLDRDDRYYLARGDVLRAAGKLDDAMAAYDKAIAAKNVNITRATFAKGSLLLEKKEYDAAGQILVDITPPDGTGQLAEAYLAMGEILFTKKEWGPGCQNYAFALAKMKTTQAPREKLNEVLTDVEKKLKAANQREIAKLWVEEAKPLIQ
ncbi:MAG: tetratricopeptide repeat protein [Myxococcota bacterium]